MTAMEGLWEPGDRIEHWLVMERLLGGAGVVYVMRDLQHDGSLARPPVVAAKTIRPELAGDAARMEQFEREAYLWMVLGAHRHVVRLFSVDRFRGQPFALAEYVPQVLFPNTLRGWMDAQALEPELALRFGAHVCRGLAHARARGVRYHLDLKPENVLVSPECVARITDWGLSRLHRPPADAAPVLGHTPYRHPDAAQTADGPVYGTPGYAAPELSRPGATPAPQADLFSLGVMLVEMATGRRPRAGTPAADLRGAFATAGPEHAERLAQTVAACLAPEPAARPGAVEEIEQVLADAFAELCGVPLELPPPAEPESATDLAQRAYGLFMLGRNDEAAQLMARLQGRAGPRETPAMLMDFKEHGWRLVLPADHVAQVEQELREHPADAERWERAVQVNQVAGRYDRALELCREWLEGEPGSVQALRSAAGILGEQHRWAEAIAWLDRLLAVAPDDAEAWAKRAEFAGAAGDRAEAVRAAARAAELSPGDAGARLRHGHHLAEEGDHRAAVAEFQQATLLDPENATAWYNLGTSLLRLGSPGAFQALERAVEIQPGFAVALNTLGGLAMQAQLFQEALVYLERAIEADPTYARPWFNKGKLYEHLEQRDLARDAYGMALRLDPGYALARAALGQLGGGEEPW
jgi:tetratricopeptide (TPR) repeat protein